MVVCQYFLKGTCKFGANCRNEHPTGGMGFGKSNSFGVFSKNQFGSAGSNAFTRWQGSSSTDDSIEKVIQNIKQEMNLWEASKMWPFSCFSHQKEAQCLAGLLDYSPEEIRLEAYKANTSGTVKEYLQSVNQLSQNFMRRRSELKSLTVASWDQEKRKISTQNSSGLFASQSSTTSLFSSPSLLFSSQPTQSGTNSPFAAPTSKPSLFGGSTSHSAFGQVSGSTETRLFGSNQPSSFGSGTSSLFGSGSYSAFGSKHQSSIFSSGQQSAVTGGQQSFFSSGQQSAVSGGQQSLFGGGQHSVFGGSQQSAFGGQQATSGGRPQTALEGGQLSSFGEGQKFSLVGDLQSNVRGGLFSKGEQTSQGLFTQENQFGKTAQQQSNLFGQSTTTLGSMTANNALESRVQQTTATTSDAHNPFLQASIQNKNHESTGAVPELPSTLKLSEKDIEAYKANEFILGQVPECPPPVELC